jgi:hypothetical protein
MITVKEGTFVIGSVKAFEADSQMLITEFDSRHCQGQEVKLIAGAKSISNQQLYSRTWTFGNNLIIIKGPKPRPSLRCIRVLMSQVKSVPRQTLSAISPQNSASDTVFFLLTEPIWTAFQG